jgi:hypothetical protein
VFVAIVFLAFVTTIMRKSIISNDVQQQQQKNLQGRVNVNKNGFLPSSFRAISSYLRIVSSGASTVARSAASVAQSIVDRDDDANHDGKKEKKISMFFCLYFCLYCVRL